MFRTPTTSSKLDQNNTKQEDDEEDHHHQHGFFFSSRLVSKESSISNPSFRVYYNGVSVAVPFVWESQPGTPKHKPHDDSALPPLTPPPSYYGHTQKPTKNKRRSSLSSTNLIKSLFTRKSSAVNASASTSSTSTLRVPTVPSSAPRFSSSSSSSLSSCFLLPFTSRKYTHHHRHQGWSRFSGCGLSAGRVSCDEEELILGLGGSSP